MNDVLLYIRNFAYSHECTYAIYSNNKYCFGVSLIATSMNGAVCHELEYRRHTESLKSWRSSLPHRKNHCRYRSIGLEFTRATLC